MRNQFTLKGRIGSISSKSSKNGSFTVVRLVVGNSYFDEASNQFIELKPKWFSILFFSEQENQVKKYNTGSDVVIQGSLGLRKIQISEDIEMDSICLTGKKIASNLDQLEFSESKNKQRELEKGAFERLKFEISNRGSDFMLEKELSEAF